MKKYERENRIDSRRIRLSYFEIMEKHPYLTPLMIRRMQYCLWTYSEIMEGTLSDENIFYPKSIYSGNIEMEIQCFPLWLLVRKKWKPVIKKFISQHQNYASKQTATKRPREKIATSR